MSVREADAASAAVNGSVSGFIDRIDGRTVTGWAWCRGRPELTVEIEIRLDDRPVATVQADRFRRDLAEARIGDGHHAFEALLDAPIAAADRPRVSAHGRCAADEPFVPLVNRTLKALPPARHPVPATAAAAEPTLGEALHALADVLSAVRRQADELEKDVHAIAATLDGMAETHAALSRQIGAIEVFQARIDSLVAGLERGGHGAGGPRRERGLVVAVGVAGTLAVVSLGFGLAAVLG